MFAVGALHCGEDVDSYHFEAVVGVQDDDQERARVFFVFFFLNPTAAQYFMYGLVFRSTTWVPDICTKNPKKY